MYSTCRYYNDMQKTTVHTTTIINYLSLLLLLLVLDGD